MTRLHRLSLLSDWLFAGDTAAPAIGRSWWWRYAATAFLIAAVIAARRPDALSTPQFWAEDGSIYFQENLTIGFVDAFLKLYRGYPNLCQRLIALVGGWVPFASAPLVYTAGAILVTALALATFCLPSFRHLVRSDALRVAVCVACACVPAGVEPFATPTNVGWFLAVWLFFVSLIQLPAAAWRVVALGVAGAVAVLSTPLACVMVPLWLLRAGAAVVRHDRRALAFALILLAAQGLVFAMAGSLGAEPDLVLDLPGYGRVPVLFQWASVWNGLAYTYALVFVPPTLLSALASEHRWLLHAGALIVIATIIRAAASAGGRRLAVVLACLCGIVGALVLTLLGRPLMSALLGAWELRLYPGRYVVFPAALALLSLAIVLDGRRTRPGRLGVALVWGAIAWAWTPSFALPRFTDLQWPMWAARLEQKRASGSDEPLEIPVNGAQRIRLGAIPSPSKPE